MLAFFRRILSSWVAVGLLALIMIAFIVTGVGTPGGGLVGGGVASDDVATVGGKGIPTKDIADRAQSTLRQARQQQPSLTMPVFLSAIGGLGPIVDQFIGARVLTAWAERHGLAASERLIGGEIASIPAFHSTTGQYDENTMNAVLSQQHISFAQLHDGIRDDLIRRQLIGPVTGGARAPDGLLVPYAQLVLSQHQGEIGVIKADPTGIPAPSDGEISDYYKGHIARYSLPERRTLRYALIGPETITPIPPTDAEITAQYKTDAAKYAASETRTIERVVLPDENAATAFAAKLTHGTTFAQAATQAGLSATDINVGAVTKPAFATSDGASVADAAFALPSGGTTAPIKTALGFTIAHVDAIKSNPARSLDQARGEIAAALTKKKQDEALATTVQQAEDAVNDGGSFNEVAGKHKLTVLTSPPLLPDGSAPTVPNYKPDPNLVVLMKAAGDATPDDEPTVEQIDANHFALLSVASVLPAAPLPLAQVKDRIAQDIVAQNATDRAKATAQGIVAAIAKGQSIAAAFAAAHQPAPTPVSLTQVQIAQAGDRLPPPVRALFRIVPGKTELVPGPGGAWFIAHLDRIMPGDPKALPAVVNATRTELTRNMSDEYAEQFANAARDEVKVKRNPQAQVKLEQQLRGGGDAAAQ